ncbi:MAG: imidazole glycerol phosphate synthase subunit HisH [Synergistaceae bacterium]|nr:imidazole glycerol phosphate synthase subunit HisH [Synergistaceae bacterium]MBR1604056.1 imidazole glycerol phosphate synthase subunit HisH [Synergistaceae bacterium]
MIAIIDYGVGNLFSLESSFNAIGYDVKVTHETGDIELADKIILPGVGAFGDAANKLKSSGLAEPLINSAKHGKNILGICLGMQLLFDKSFEYGEHEGLGLIPGEILPMADIINKDLKIPQIGWNALIFKNGSKLFKYINNNDCVYFVHSYYADCEPEYVSAVTEYGADITACVERKNIFGCQFHPEKSGAVGLNILKAFCEL